MESSIDETLRKNHFLDILASSKIATPRAFTQRNTKREKK